MWHKGEARQNDTPLSVTDTKDPRHELRFSPAVLWNEAKSINLTLNDGADASGAVQSRGCNHMMCPCRGVLLQVWLESCSSASNFDPFFVPFFSQLRGTPEDEIPRAILPVDYWTKPRFRFHGNGRGRLVSVVWPMFRSAPLSLSRFVPRPSKSSVSVRFSGLPYTNRPTMDRLLCLSIFQLQRW